MLRLALSRLRTHRLRAALTMLGVIIGVASVVSLVGVGQGTTTNITARLNGLGTNLLTISGTGGFGANATTTLDLEDADAIGELTSVAGVAPEVSTSATVTAGDESTDTTILGTTEAYPSVRAYDIWQGSFLTDMAVERALRVAVLGSTTATNLGLGAEDVGSEIEIGGLPFTLIGILQPKGGTGGADPDDQVLVPVNVVQKYFVGGDDLRSIGVSVADAAEMDAANAEITALLRERHELGAADDDDFSVFDQAQLLEAAESISGTLTLLLGGIASISLVVGGIGIMNIMLVSVRERTREIGIRKAVGARGRDILAQFLVEALTLSLLGGLIGILVGLAASAGIGQLAGWGFSFNPSTVIAAVLFSLAVGVVFGVWPARQPARLDPIGALRYE
jgi:putative ABC transport system permease protein